MISIRTRTIGALLTGLTATAVITTSVPSASAATMAAPTVRAASTALHVTTSKAIRVGVTARHARTADHLSVQQYYRNAWHLVTAYRVARASSIMRHTFNLGRAPAGKYLIRVALVRNGHTKATTGRIAISCTAATPPPPPPPPAP